MDKWRKAAYDLFVELYYYYIIENILTNQYLCIIIEIFFFCVDSLIYYRKKNRKFKEEKLYNKIDMIIKLMWIQLLSCGSAKIIN